MYSCVIILYFHFNSFFSFLNNSKSKSSISFFNISSFIFSVLFFHFKSIIKFSILSIPKIELINFFLSSLGQAKTSKSFCLAKTLLRKVSLGTCNISKIKSETSFHQIISTFSHTRVSFVSEIKSEDNFLIHESITLTTLYVFNQC